METPVSAQVFYILQTVSKLALIFKMCILHLFNTKILILLEAILKLSSSIVIKMFLKLSCIKFFQQSSYKSIKS